MLRKDLRGLDTGRLIARFTGLLRKAVHKKGVTDFSFFADYEFQADHPLEALLQVAYRCKEIEGIVQLQIPIMPGGVKKHSPLVTEYYFDLVLLYGDPTKDDGLRVESVTNYSYTINEESTCTLTLPTK